VTAIQNAVDDGVHELEAIAALYQIVPTVDCEQFSTFVEPFLRQSLVIQSLDWIPRVRHESRDAWETEVRKRKPTFSIAEGNPQGRMVKAADRTEYFPVLCIEPLEENKRALGFDIGSAPIFSEALARMRFTERPVATMPVTFDREETAQRGILVFSPVSVGAELRGFALGAFRAADLINGALVSSRPREVALHVVDSAATADPVLYVSPAYRPVGTSDRHYRAKIQVAGRPWNIDCSPTTSGAAWTGAGAWLALITSLGLTVIVAFYFSERAHAEAMLRQAHDQLATANENLAGKTTQLEGMVRELMLTRAQLVQEEKQRERVRG